MTHLPQIAQPVAPAAMNTPEPVFFGCASVGKRSPAKGGDPVPHCDSGVLEAGIPIHLVALSSYGQVAFKQCRYWIALRKKNDGRHGLMYFDIALPYHATIKVEQHETRQIKSPEQDYYNRPPPPPVPVWLWHADSKSNCSGQ